MTAILPDKTSGTGRTGDHPTTGFLPASARERLEPRLREAVSEFVDSPAEAVEKADRLLAETVEQLHEALLHRHGELRSAWSGEKGHTPGTGHTPSATSTGSTGQAAPARRAEGTAPGADAGFGDGTPGGAGKSLSEDRERTGPREDEGTSPRDLTGTARDGAADARGGLAGSPSTGRAPGATTDAATGAATRAPGDEGSVSRPGHGAASDTERLRLALQEYRGTTERLLSL
ncbi:hypothetical protein [Streptomyces sp. SPB074]|uniref:hypothetical protein n=1 Tax=Streptomyces sp. (strain SPB074) TaxID=465543 RepID=UPI00017F192B|nr:hypothetical protein [Streptomyces sp. SPB074]EDY42623.1 translation initiation factor IF-2 [Streptomyces sp. SPB074]